MDMTQTLTTQPDTQLAEIPFVLLDLETTGLSPDQGDRICEIALMRVERGAEVLRYEQLVNPGRALTAGAYAVNQIAPEMLENAPTFAQLLPTLLPMLHGAVVEAHNAHFDMSFLALELARAGAPPLGNVVLDTLALARACIESPRYNLHMLAVRLGAEPPCHRAMSDVLALKVLFDHLLELLGQRGIATLSALQQAQWGSAPGQLQSPLPGSLALALQQGRRLRIAYQRFDGSVVEREILPLGVAARGTGSILHAYCYLRNAPRAFAVERIKLLDDRLKARGGRSRAAATATE